MVGGVRRESAVNATRLVGLGILLATLAVLGYAVWVLALWRS